MEKKSSIAEIAGALFICIFIIPIIVGYIVKGLIWLSLVCANLIEKIKHKRKIKKGMKNGSIIKVNGDYYEVNVDKK